MINICFQSVTLISSPYHVGIKHVSVGGGPTYLKQREILNNLKNLNIPIEEVEIPSVENGFEGEIGRSFELMRRTSELVRTAHEEDSFPIVLAGNCSASVGVVAGLSQTVKCLEQKVACVWFDAHDDFNTPDTLTSGYFDSMGVAMLGGLCFQSLLATVPGFSAVDLRRLIHVGMRSVNDIERQHVESAGLSVVWGSESSDEHPDFEGGLATLLKEKDLFSKPTHVHFDVDSLDTSIGRANRFAAPGGLREKDLLDCFERIVTSTIPLSLTVASFDTGLEGADEIADMAVRGIVCFVKLLKSNGRLAFE